MRISAENFGNKIAASKISKTIHSANIREKRIMQWRNANFDSKLTANKNHCNECGFCIRGENHLEGAHHNGTIIQHKRKR